MSNDSDKLFGDDEPLFSDDDKLFKDEASGGALFSEEAKPEGVAGELHSHEVNVFTNPNADLSEAMRGQHWKVLVVDDEEDIHQVTKLALRTFSYRNKSIKFFDAYSAHEAEAILSENKDIAIVLLDVVMESNHAGLELVKQIRENYGNYLTRIILRTGQPGQAPERDVINKYEINDYKTKTELTQDKLYTVVMSGLRSFESLLTIDSYRQTLEHKVEERTRALADANLELEKLSLVASKTDNAVAILDSKGNFEWLNEGFLRLYEMSLDDFTNQLGRNVVDTVKASFVDKDGDRDPESQRMQHILNKINTIITEKRTVSFEFSTVTKSGKFVIVQTTMTPILDEEGNLEKMVAIDSDITKIKAAEEKIKKQKEEITDSIRYAKRIQNAILPPEDYVTESLPEHFILFKPRDIVSGDFYWAAQKGRELVVVAADCTGHGVPGAFMSILGVTFLNEIIGKTQMKTAGEMLDKLRDNIVKSLHQKNVANSVVGQGDIDNVVKDGMDIAMSILNLDTLQLQYAGAHNPLYVIRKEAEGYSLEEIKADKMPIGYYSYEIKPFTNHIINLKKGDTFYLFSDGFADQFGGPDGKKLKYKQFKEILLNVQSKSMKDQKNALNIMIERWMGDLEQLDDMVVIGMRV